MNMDRLPLSVNKSNLLRLKEEVQFAKDALELLGEKKEALLGHIGALSSRAERVRSSLNKDLEETYRHLRVGILMHGLPACERAALAPKAGEAVEIKDKGFMGVTIPLVRIILPEFLPSFGFNETGASLDSVAKRIRGSMETVAELAEIEVGLFRLVREIKKTIKRINALENVYLARYEATIKHMEESLEEKEREALFQLKRQKKRRGEVPIGSV
jgi:V/A-type H+-transporting ATPase subunit D